MPDRLIDDNSIIDFIDDKGVTQFIDDEGNVIFDARLPVKPPGHIRVMHFTIR